MSRICATMNFCEEDAYYLPQFFAEAERLNIPFAAHCDRCSPETKTRVKSHPLCFGITSQDDPAVEYHEQHKQAVFDLAVAARKFSWLIYWDIDEIWGKDTPDQLGEIPARVRTEDILRTRWVNCWGDLNHVRVDTLFANAMRVKIYNIADGRVWYFDHKVTYGAKLHNGKGCGPGGQAVQGDTDIVCLHTGLMTRELRELHKVRWDRIYTTAVGRNQYGFWNYCLDEETYPPTVIPNPHL